MQLLKTLADEAKFGDQAQQTVVGGFFSAISRIFSDGAITRHPDGAAVRLSAPLRVMGPGSVQIRGIVTLGVLRSANLFQGIYLASMVPSANIFIDDGVILNNGANIMSEGAGITIGKRCLIGTNFWCLDSNFHNLTLGRRLERDPNPKPVVIEDDVFIGVNVTILKDVVIGKASIISAGSVIFPGFRCPPNSTVRGNPAVVVSQFEPMAVQA